MRQPAADCLAVVFYVSAVSLTHGHWTRPPRNITGLYGLQVVFKALGDVGASYQMQSHIVILIAYCIGMKKDHQTLLSFVVFAGKWQKRTFWHKVACKKFSWSGQRGEASHRAPLKYALNLAAAIRSIHTLALNVRNFGKYKIFHTALFYWFTPHRKLLVLSVNQKNRSFIRITVFRRTYTVYKISTTHHTLSHGIEWYKQGLNKLIHSR